ncbi:hypothetical protein DSO57_1010236 [Entomophthora muscae]|uniref:Uncharacterized protein n=1 Tax=Entomophthora muscae TaxID=34485 RepID=A0ACC2RXP7_9FUNG|nr:hypothetical protein DSO57_1010236 [Entomophthora muscae]
MSGLPMDWTPYTLDTKIPEGFVLYQNMVMLVPAFNTLSEQGFFQGPTAIPQVTDKSIVATKAQTLPVNISYDTQGALNEFPLDVSNIMNESGGNVKWRELHPN